MTERNGLELSRRKILASVGVMGAAAAGAGFGTSAYFSDGEVFEDNTITAGELDLRIDWQQLYYGPEENADHYAPYGEAGHPFVNAHPDHDTTGEQSLDTDELDGFEDEGVVRYSDDGANIQEYLTCDTLENYEVPEDFDNGVRMQDSLIELEDVKPGDCGEVTFSLHLCDNPGYIWWIGQKTEFDEDLAKSIIVKAWYDKECTNEFDEDDGDKVLVETTDLYTFLNERLTPDGRMLEPGVYDAGVIGESGRGNNGPAFPGEIECAELGKIEWNGAIGTIEEGEVIETRTNPLEYDVRLDAPDGYSMTITLSELLVKTEDDEFIVADDEGDFGELVRFDWDIIDDPDDNGMCRIAIKAAQEEEAFDLRPGCTTGQTNVWSPATNPKGIPQGISNIQFDYCDVDEDTPPTQCFPENETFCVSFEWCFPPNIDVNGIEDVNDLQGKSVSFDLGFYTEQCRHNGDPDGPSGFS